MSELDWVEDSSWAEEMRHRDVLARLIMKADELSNLLCDDDLTEDKLREASETLLPLLHDDARDAIRELKAADARIAELEQDKARLDWLEHQYNGNTFKREFAQCWRAAMDAGIAFQNRLQSPDA